MQRTRVMLPALLVAAALLSGCATRASLVESNRAQDWSGKLQKVYVQVTFMKEWGQEFSDAFEKRVGVLLTECGVASKVVRRSDLDLDSPEARAAELRQFGADSVLSVRPTGGGLNQDGVVVNRVFAAQLVVTPSRPVWRAVFTVYRGGARVETLAQRGEAFAIEMTNRMKADRLLGSCAELPVPKPGLK